MPGLPFEQNSRIVCVLGMHRSGTSVVSRVLNLLGYYLGPDDHLMPPTDFNPKGYWENRSFANLNDAILARFGGTWDEPPAFPSGWETSAGLGDLRDYAAEFIQGEFGACDRWSWKDPRTCLTLPFWQRILPSIKYVIVLRNPVDVARSLQRRDGFVFAKGLRLWLRYIQSAWIHTADQDRFVLHYEDWLRDPVAQSERLLRFLDGTEAPFDESTRAAITELLDHNLAHHHSTLVDMIKNPEVPPRLGAFYAAVNCSGRNEPEYGKIERILKRATEEESVANSPSGTSTSFAAAEALREKVRSLEAALDTQAALLVQIDQKKSTVEGERNRLAAQAQSLEAAIRTQSYLLAHSRADTAGHLSRIEDLYRRVAALQQRIDHQSEMMDAIETSLAWKMIMGYRRLRDRCFPPDSHRRRAYEAARDLGKSLLGPKIHHQLSDHLRTERSSPGTPPKVSVVVPNYNHAPYLLRRIESIFCQHYGDFEVILLDDGSTDSSREILQLYQFDPKCRLLLSPTNSGKTTAQWQKGLDQARGDYIWFAESDDYASAFFLQKLVPVLEQNPAVGLVYCQSYKVDPSGRVLGDNLDWTDDLDPERWRADFINHGRDEIRQYLSKKNTIPNASAVLLRSSVLRSLAPLTSSYQLCGDWELWVKVLLHSDIAFVAESLNYWRHLSSNVRTVPAGVLELQEGSEIIRFLGVELGLSETESTQRLEDFAQRCRQWREASATT